MVRVDKRSGADRIWGAIFNGHRFWLVTIIVSVAWIVGTGCRVDFNNGGWDFVNGAFAAYFGVTVAAFIEVIAQRMRR